MVWHQLQAALALACERIVCLAEAPFADMATLQREAERRGAQFSAVSGIRQVGGTVAAADTLIAFAPGVLPDSEWLNSALGSRAGIVTLPADGAVERGFERIDRERAWGGVLATRGDAVEALSALPPDADAVSGLLRIALQRGAHAIGVPERWLDEDRWTIVADTEGARRFEEGWYDRHVAQPVPGRPGEWFAHRLARRMVGRLAGTPTLPTIVKAASVALAVLSAIGGYFGHTAAALGGIAVAAFADALGKSLDAHAGAGRPTDRKVWPERLRESVLDAALVAVTLSPVEFGQWHPPFAMAVLIAVVRLARESAVPPPARPIGDRTFVAALLCIGAIAGMTAGTAAIVALAGLAVRLFWPAPRG